MAEVLDTNAAEETDVPAIEAVGISKHFGGTVALSDADFQCHKGRIHALLGANGAGKSTLVKILCGVQSADTGVIRLEGREVTLDSPVQAAAQGVSAVFQELSLCPHLTVAENVMLAHEPAGPLGQIRNRTLQKRVRGLFDRLGIDHINVNGLVANLALADRQLVEIVKALSHDPSTLIVDEGTSALGHEESRQLFDLLKRLRSEGKAIIFISHRMAEVREIADQLTVFRNGTDVAMIAARDIDENQIVEYMLGQRVQQSFPERIELTDETRVRLEVEQLSAGSALRGVSFSARAGEVVGLAGLEGQGQGDLLLALFGMLRRTSGAVRVDGRQVRLGRPWRAIRAGFALIPEDRKTQGLLQPLSLRENIVMASLGRLSKFGMVDRARENETTQRGMERMQIVASSPELPVSALSGGNQQKVVVAKWLEAGGEIFLFYDPTRGVDVGAKGSFYQLIADLASAGKTVIWYTTETSELVGLCHRVLVMNDGRFETELSGPDITEPRILAESIGGGSGTERSDNAPAEASGRETIAP